jgi:ribosomal protein L11 methylase PrmA
VLGVDHEAESVEATLGNAKANAVTVGVGRFDLRRDGAVPTAPLVLANLLLPLLLEVAEAGFDGEVPELMIASGLLTEQADQVADAFGSKHGLLEQERLGSGEWAALLLARAR